MVPSRVDENAPILKSQLMRKRAFLCRIQKATWPALPRCSKTHLNNN